MKIKKINILKDQVQESYDNQEINEKDFNFLMKAFEKITKPKTKINICLCPHCENSLHLEWSMHCTGSDEFVTKNFNGLGENSINYDDGGCAGDNYYQLVRCSNCGFETEEPEKLENCITKEIEI